jgi:hypothetical protein
LASRRRSAEFRVNPARRCPQAAPSGRWSALLGSADHRPGLGLGPSRSRRILVGLALITIIALLPPPR